MMIRAILAISLTISILYADYTAMKIDDYVNIVATQNKINIATDKKIEKDFDFYINRPIKESVSINVLNELLESNGYALIKKSDNYYIIKAKKDLLINKIKIFKIKYADTQKIKEQAKKILKGYFKNIKSTKTSGNAKVLNAYEERNTQDNKTKMKTTITEEKINYSINILDNKSLAVTYKDEFVPSVMSKIIKAMDHPLTRIKVEVKISEVNSDALKEFSTDLDFSAQTAGMKIAASSNSKDGNVKSGLSYSSDDKELSTFNLSAAIHALEKTGQAKIKSNPVVFLYEGHSALLNNGKSFPIAYDNTVVNNNSTTTSTQYKDKNTGLTINLTFEQYRSGMIYLKMDLDISLVEDYDANDRQLITINRKLQNQMIIEPNKEIDMAGLTQSVESESNGGIPLLQDIPWIGTLFKFEKSTKEDRVLVIQIKASIVDNPSDKFKNIWENI